MASRRIILGAFALATFVFAAGTAGAKEWTKVRIATEGAYAPFNYVTPEGELAGFEVDLAKAICAELKIECELVQQDWDGMIPALLARKYDAIMASMSMTDERKKRIDFSDKYYNTPTRLTVKKGSDIDGSVESLAGKKVGVQRETIQDRYASDVFEPAGAEIVRYGTTDEANLDLVAGRLDARLDDVVAISEGLLDRPEGADFEFVGPVFNDPKWFGPGVGVGMRKGEDDLKALFNKGIAAVRANGKYAEIQGKYFKFDVYGE
jgi:arginine/ornithine transport system substrate-binding protein